VFTISTTHAPSGATSDRRLRFLDTATTVAGVYGLVYVAWLLAADVPEEVYNLVANVGRLAVCGRGG
jgi:hypothetical protein